MRKAHAIPREETSIIFVMRNAFCLALFIVMVLALGAQTLSQPDSFRPARPSADEQRVLDLLNRDREKANLPRLHWDEQTATAARAHSALMAGSFGISHQFPGEPDVADRVAGSGARFTVSGENVAVADSPEEVHMALMNSPGHRANILSTRYNSVGIGVVVRKGRLYVTQDFVWSTPVYSEIQFQEAFIAAFNRARKARAHRALDARADSRLHSAACTSDGNIQGVLDSVSGNVRVALFTLSEPQKLPAQLADYVESQRLERMNVGVCFRPDQQHGAANFWVAVAFYE
jgi:uncharacterized protein YkwD